MSKYARAAPNCWPYPFHMTIAEMWEMECHMRGGYTRDKRKQVLNKRHLQDA